MWAQRRNRQPLRKPITPYGNVANGYMHWFYENGKPFILTEDERARVIRGPLPASKVPSTEPNTLMPPVFSHSSTSHFHFTMLPPMEGFFTGAFQSDSSMMSAPLHSPGQFSPSPHQFQTSVPPLALYPLQGPNFRFTYGMVQHTPPGSLFASGPSESGHHNEDDDDADADEDEDDDYAHVPRNPRKKPSSTTLCDRGT
ncbi:hypothetical protein V6N13_039994 [Hibiscus sabdariffa]